MAESAASRQSLSELLASGLFAAALGAAGAWGLPHVGGATLHRLEVRGWDVSECDILGRWIVEYEGGLLSGVGHEEFTFEFELREAETGRRLKALASPDPLTRLYPTEVPDHWIGDMPGTRAECRTAPRGERAYLRAGSLVDLGLMIFGTAMAGAFALIGVVGVAGAVWGFVRRESP